MHTSVASLQKKTLPPKERHADMQHAVSLMVSRADRELYVLQDGKILAKGPIEIARPNQPFGSHVFVLATPHNDGEAANWHAIRHESGPATS
jgi:hypothetical protein